MERATADAIIEAGKMAAKRLGSHIWVDASVVQLGTHQPAQIAVKTNSVGSFLAAVAEKAASLGTEVALSWERTNPTRSTKSRKELADFSVEIAKTNYDYDGEHYRFY